MKWGGPSGARTPCIWPASNSLNEPEYTVQHTKPDPTVTMIVYRSLADDTIWTRPKTVFFEIIEHEGKQVPRFAPLVDE